MRGSNRPALLLVAAVGGCSLLYDVDELGPPSDARPVDAADADPGDVVLVAQTEVVEGLGDASDESVRPCTTVGCDGRRSPLVILGSSSDDDGDGMVIVRGASIRGVPGAVPLIDVLAFDAGLRWTVLAVRVPVTAALVEQAYVIELLVKKAGRDEVVPVPMQGLTELALVSGDGPLRPRYSKVTVPAGTVTRYGNAPVRLVATSDLVVDGHLDLDARFDRPGPGGCRGGAPGIPAGCAFGGGQNAGDAATSSGGAGFADVGAGIGAGVATGRPHLIPLGAGGNAGNGGGAHGQAIGGHGAGVVELTAAGAIRSGAVGRVTALGGTPPAVMARSPGGGSGGAILLRAGLEIAFNQLPTSISAIGGGATSVRGADGRIRIDTPVAPLAKPSLPAPGFEGAAWTSVPLIGRSPIDVTFRRAQQARRFVVTPLTVDGIMAPTCAAAAVDETCSRTLDFPTPGVHTLCLYQDAGESFTAAENATCVQLVSLPAAP